MSTPLVPLGQHNTHTLYPLPLRSSLTCEHPSCPTGSVHRTEKAPRQNRVSCSPERVWPSDTSADSKLYASPHPLQRKTSSCVCRSHCQGDGARCKFAERKGQKLMITHSKILRLFHMKMSLKRILPYSCSCFYFQYRQHLSTECRKSLLVEQKKFHGLGED